MAFESAMVLDPTKRISSAADSVSETGVFSPNDYNDDKHELATIENLRHFNAYIRSIRAWKIPVVCEIADLSTTPDETLTKYINDLRIRLE